MIPSNRKSRLLLATLIAITWSATANAYVDPGTGSLFTQVLIAGVLGAAFATKSAWRRVWNLLNRKAVRSEAPSFRRNAD